MVYCAQIALGFNVVLSTPKPLYNMVYYNTILDITWIRVGPQMGCGERKYVQIIQVTRPIYQYMVKMLKNLLRNQKADDPETWYAASGARILPNLFK